MIVCAIAEINNQPEKFECIEARGVVQALSALGNDVHIITIAPADTSKLKELVSVIPVELTHDENAPSANPSDDIVEEVAVLEGEIDGIKTYFLASNQLSKAGTKGCPDTVADIFGRAVPAAIKALKLDLKLIHAQGWQSALIAKYAPEGIHTVYALFDVPHKEIGPEGQEYIRTGISESDAVIVGSQKYLDEIADAPESDFIAQSLKQILEPSSSTKSKVSKKIYAITLPIGDEINPEKDKALKAPFSQETLKERPKNFTEFAVEYKLKKNLKTLVVGIVGDLRGSQGSKLLDTIEGLAENEIRTIGAVVVDELGQAKIQGLTESYPGLVGVSTQKDNNKESFDNIRRVSASSDVILFTEEHVNSSLLPLVAMKYGALPVAPNHAIYKDVIEDYNPNRESGNGFLYEGDTKYNMLAAVIRAQEVRKFPYDWAGIADTAADLHFFWRDSAKIIVDIYREVLGTTDDADKQAEEASQVPVIDEK